MRYIGSKCATLPWLSRLVAERAPGATSLCDPFAGTCTVARHFKNAGFRLITGDVLTLSYVMQVATIGCDAPPSFQGLVNAGVDVDAECRPTAVLNYLDSLAGENGYLHENYSPAGAEGRLFFTPENAARIDAVRSEITTWAHRGLIDDRETAYLLASLIEAADRVANTAGTYYAYLKAVSRKALLPLHLRLPPTTTAGARSECHQTDARDLVASVETDILYLDPPYNQRNYRRYYHLPESIASGATPEPYGRSGAPVARLPCSDFCRPAHARSALSEICEKAQARHILVHYTTDGIISHDHILEMLQNRGTVTFQDLTVRAYSSRRGKVPPAARHRIYWCDVNQRNA